MRLPSPFKLERYFARWEFAAHHLLGPSDCESLTQAELLALADAECRAWWNSLALGYTESAGHPRLRAAVAALYEHMTADDILIAAPEEAIFLALSTLLGPGDHAIVLTPAYQSLTELPRATGAAVTHWPLRSDGVDWQLDMDGLRASITAQTRVLVINFPHNPTGYLPSPSRLDELLAIARAHELFVFSDEMYRLLEPDGVARLPAVCDVYERGITLSGLSKAFGLPGLRIGWLATRAPDVRERCLGLKDYTTICASAPSEVLATIALGARESIVARNRRIVADNTGEAARFFAARPSLFQWLAPRAGSVAFPRWRGPIALAELCRRGLERGLMIVGGEMFDFPGSHVRVGLGRRTLAAALAELGRLCDELEHR
jgi:aspartate/methionine/tyrosine aminotransferase